MRRRLRVIYIVAPIPYCISTFSQDIRPLHILQNAGLIRCWLDHREGLCMKKIILFVLVLVAAMSECHAATNDYMNYMKQVWPLLDDSRYAEALPIIEKALESKDEIRGKDYLYGWAMLCHVIVGNYDKAAEYYEIIRIKYGDGGKSDDQWGHSWGSELDVTRSMIVRRQNKHRSAYKRVFETDKRLATQQKEEFLRRIRDFNEPYSSDDDMGGRRGLLMTDIDIKIAMELLGDRIIRIEIVGDDIRKIPPKNRSRSQTDQSP